MSSTNSEISVVSLESSSDSVELSNDNGHISGGNYRHLLDEYELGRVLGKGHFATVRLARHAPSLRMCALKVIEHDKVESPRQHELFRREIAALQAVSEHPNVMGLRRVVPSAVMPGSSMLLDQKHVFLLELEYCSGGDLFGFVLKGGEFPESVARHAARQLLSALAHCHASGVAHRDLKPENILVAGPEQGWALKVGDFGLASLQTPNPGQNLLCATHVGTKSYQAPEVLASTGSAYDGAQADGWSIGVVLFILLLGSPPFAQADRSDWWFNAMRLNRQEDFWRAHLRAPAPHVNPPARAMLNRLLMVDPSHRASPAEVLLDPWLNTSAAEVEQDANSYVNHFAKVAGHVQTQMTKEVNAAVAMAETSAAQEVVFNACVARSAGLTLEDKDEHLALDAIGSAEVVTQAEGKEEEEKVCEDEEEEARKHVHSWEAETISSFSIVTRKHSLIVASGSRQPTQLIDCVRAALMTAGATVTEKVGLIFIAAFSGSDDANSSSKEGDNTFSEPRPLQLPQPPSMTNYNNDDTIPKNLELEVRLSPHKALSGVKQEGRPSSGVWVLEASRCGVGDVWSLALAWRTVLFALSTSGYPEAKAALQESDATDSSSTTAKLNGSQEPNSWQSTSAAAALLKLAAPRLPPPSEDDPHFNSLLRMAPIIEDSGTNANSAAVPSVLIDAADEVF